AAVSLTLTPAIMTLLGSRLFRLRGGVPRNAPAREGSARMARFLVRRLRKRGWAIAALLLVGAALTAAASPLLHLRLSVSFTEGLPQGDEVQAGAAVLAKAGLEGITGPTEVLVMGQGVTHQRDALKRLQAEIGEQRGVAQVVGPAQNPAPDRF